MAEDSANGAEGLTSTASIRMPPSSAAMPRPGQQFAGRYVIERLLGRGGMGEVYLATQQPLGRKVAIKVLKVPDSVEDDPNFDQRFLREAAASARLQHPNTITVFDFGQTDDGVLYIVMEYLEGNDVRTLLRFEDVFPARRAIHVAKQVCKSLREAHRKGMVHRDLKPANVLLIERDEDPDYVKVLDFGLVKFHGEESGELTLAGKFLGSPRYTSPEALDRNKDVDHRADIYAVGILLYSMLTGKPPFDGDPLQVLNAHLHETPQPMYKMNPVAQTTPELEAIVARCLAKNPDDRFQTMSELLTALRGAGSYFGDAETATLELEESLDLDEDGPPSDESSMETSSEAILSASGIMRPVSSSSLKPLKPAPHPVTPRPTARPGQKRRPPPPQALPVEVPGAAPLRPLPEPPPPRKRSPVVPIVVALVLLGGAVAAWFMTRDRGAGPTTEEAALLPKVSISGTVTPDGAEVEIWQDGAWTRVGTAPLDALMVPMAEGAREVTFRFSRDGYEPRKLTRPVSEGKVGFDVTLDPVPVATPAPAATPATSRPPEAAATTPPPRRTPRPARPTPAPSPVETGNKSPAGYKDNPY